VSIKGRLDKLERLFRGRKPVNPYDNLPMVERAERALAILQRHAEPTNPYLAFVRQGLAGPDPDSGGRGRGRPLARPVAA
jgi:hypothetical protein